MSILEYPDFSQNEQCGVSELVRRTDLSEYFLMSEVDKPDPAKMDKKGQPEANSPLYRRMSVTMHLLIFLYAAAFWIQTGVFPVSIFEHISFFVYIRMVTYTS